MEDSKSSQEKFIEQIASFDPILNPSDFENIENDTNANKQSLNSNFKYFSDNADNVSENSTEYSSIISPISSKTSKNLSDSSEKSSKLVNHDFESPSQAFKSALALQEMNYQSSSKVNAVDCISLSPDNSIKAKEKKSDDQSFNPYRFNNNTNISSSSGSYKNDNYNSNLTSPKKKYECKKHHTRVEYNSVGGTAADCGPSLRRRSFQQIKEKVNSAHSYKFGRFNITYSSHSEVSQSENSSCEENEKKNEGKKKSKKEDKNIMKETTKNIKVKRFNISFSKNSSNDSTGSLISECDQENTHLKHASSDKTVGDRHHTDNIAESNNKNKQIDNDDDDDIFYQMQQSSMPVLGRHKKKGNKDNTNNKSNKTSTNNNINENSNHIIDNDKSNIANITTNDRDKNNSSQPKKQNNAINNNININVLSPPKSTPFNPPILDINMDSTSTTSSLLGKLCGGSEIEVKGHTDDPNDLINIF